MYTIVVIDDELPAIQCIVKMLERFNKVSYQVITAQKGTEAFSKLKNITPDILLVDIEMEEMDGFTFIHEIVTRYNAKAKAIMVTAYSQFEYSQKAIKIHAFDYILKPVKEQELFAALDKAIEDLKADKNNLEYVNQYKMTYVSKGIERVLMDRQGRLEGSEDIAEILKVLEHHYYFCAAIRIVQMQEGCKEPGFELQKLLDTIKRQRPEKKFRLIVLEISEIEFAIIGSVREMADMHMIIHDMYRLCPTFARYYSIGMTRPLTDFKQIRTYYEQSLLSARQQLLDRSDHQNRVVEYATLYPADESIRYSDDQGQMAAIFDLISLGSDEVKLKMSEFFLARTFHTFKDFKDAVVRCLIGIQQLARENGLMMEPLAELEDVIRQSRNAKEIVLWMTELTEKIIFRVDMAQHASSHQRIHKVIAFINNHYTDHLPLNFVADMASVHVAYFCEVFKKMTGKTYVEYTTKLRVDKAMSLLEKSSLAVTDIAMKVGYEDAEYFRRVFRKYTGVSPNQYRRRTR